MYKQYTEVQFERDFKVLKLQLEKKKANVLDKSNMRLMMVDSMAMKLQPLPQSRKLNEIYSLADRRSTSNNKQSVSRKASAINSNISSSKFIQRMQVGSLNSGVDNKLLELNFRSGKKSYLELVSKSKSKNSDVRLSIDKQTGLKLIKKPNDSSAAGLHQRKRSPEDAKLAGRDSDKQGGSLPQSQFTHLTSLENRPTPSYLSSPKEGKPGYLEFSHYSKLPPIAANKSNVVDMPFATRGNNEYGLQASAYKKPRAMQTNTSNSKKETPLDREEAFDNRVSSERSSQKK